MHIHYLQHVPFEGPGYITDWLAAAGHRISATRFFESDALPEAGAVDLLVVMGGPMSVNDTAEFPWLIAEQQFIREVIRAGRPVLGICLGAQLIASALGSRVYPNHCKEIGWLPIQGVPSGEPDLFSFPPTAEVFHWHGETFDLPAGSHLLASSAGCRNQAFQLGNAVIGLQFHLETTPDSVQQLVGQCGHELIPAQYVQSEQEILTAPPERYAVVNRLMGELLAFLLRKAALSLPHPAPGD